MTTALESRTTGDSHVRTTREWIVLAMGAVLVAALCLLAGQWQWNRHQARDARIEIVVANFDAPAVPLQTLLPGPSSGLSAEDEWRTVTVQGTYRAQDTVLLRNRPVESTAGFHVLVPFESTDGLVLIVNRGFVPTGVDGSQPDSVPEPAAGTINLTARLRPDEPASSRGAPQGQIQAINTQAVLAAGAEGADWAAGRTTGAYLALEQESPAPAQALHGLPKPSTDPGSHLSYTFQWLVFAAGAIGGFLVLLRRERNAAIRRHREESGPAAALPQNTPADVAAWIVGADPLGKVSRRRRGPSDEETEDAQLDEQGL